MHLNNHLIAANSLLISTEQDKDNMINYSINTIFGLVQLVMRKRNTLFNKISRMKNKCLKSLEKVLSMLHSEFCTDEAEVTTIYLHML